MEPVLYALSVLFICALAVAFLVLWVREVINDIVHGIFGTWEDDDINLPKL